jgi:hypothetical protein
MEDACVQYNTARRRLLSQWVCLHIAAGLRNHKTRDSLDSSTDGPGVLETLRRLQLTDRAFFGTQDTVPME